MSSIRQKLVKPWVIMPLVAVLAFGGWFAFVRDDDPPATATGTTPQTVAATKGTMARTVSADGTVAAADTDDLSFTSSGTVTAVNVAAGDAVKEGDVLATIDSAELEAAVDEAESSLADAEAALSDDTDADASDAQLAADRSSVETASDALDDAQEALDGAQLVATFDGTVAAVNITKGDQLGDGGTGGTGQTGSDSGSGASSGNLGDQNGNGGDGSGSTAQIQVISAGRFTVDLSLDDSDISEVKVGQVASVAVSTSSSSSSFGGPGGFPGGFPGVVTRFGNGETNQSNTASDDGDTTTTTTPAIATDDGAKGLVTEVGKVADASSGVASYPVTVAFNDASGDYNVGATVTVAITYESVEDAISVPSFAVSTASDGTSTVTVLADGEQETRTVTTGLTSGAMVQITSGLAEGEQVVLALPGGPTDGGDGGTNGSPGGAPTGAPGGAFEVQGGGS